MNNKLIEKIKSRGYWRINFRPLIYKDELITLLECKDIVQKNMVQQRGWNYPHFPYRQKEKAGLEPAKNYYIGWIDWEYNIEFWHMYQSGQFLHYLALREDWVGPNDFIPYQPLKPGEKLEILSTLYLFTEIFEFMSRLTRSGLYENGVEIFITLNNTLNRELCIMDTGRTPLYDKYQTKMSSIKFEKEYSKAEIISKPKELALNALSYFLERFGWHTLPLITFKNDQDKIYP